MRQPEDFLDFLQLCESIYGQAAIAIAKTDTEASGLVRNASAICGWWADRLLQMIEYEESIALRTFGGLREEWEKKNQEYLDLQAKCNELRENGQNEWQEMQIECNNIRKEAMEIQKERDELPELSVPVITSIDEIVLNSEGIVKNETLLSKLWDLAMQKPDVNLYLESDSEDKTIENLLLVFDWTIPAFITAAIDMALQTVQWGNPVQQVQEIERVGIDISYCTICGAPYTEAPEGQKCRVCKAGINLFRHF